MRLFGIIPALFLSFLAGCTSCPNYYGPGMTPSPYGSCVGTQSIAPPVPLGASGRRHRPTLAEHKQARDLRRWYRELNRESRPRKHAQGGFCQHCQNGLSNGYDEFYDEAAYYDGGMLYDGHYDGQIIDGGFADAGSYPGSYCPDCQNQHQHSQPMMHESMMPQPAGEPAPAPPAEPTPATDNPETPSAFLNEIYSPSVVPPPATVQQTNIPPVEQVLYAPTGSGTTP